MPAPGALKSKELQEQERANKAREHEERRRTDETIRSNASKENIEKGKVKFGPVSANLSVLRGMSNKDQAPASRGYITTKSLADNDPAWYNQVPGLVENVANLSFNLPTGSPFTTFSDKSGGSKQYGIPGIMRIDYLPTFGPFSQEGVGDEANAFNIAATALYASIRSKNSGAINYAPADVLMVIGAMDSIYSAMSELARIYSVISTYSASNWYIGRALMASTGYSDIYDWSKKLADFRASYNTLVSKVNTIHIPAGLPLFARHSWMNASFYADNDTSHFQIMYYHPIGYYSYRDNVGEANLNGLVFTQMNTVQDLLDWVDVEISQLMVNTDIGIISGDILKAYDENGLVKLETIPEFYPVTIAYSPEVNNQIDNATVYPVSAFFNGRIGLYQTTTGIPYYSYEDDLSSDDLGPRISIGAPTSSAPPLMRLGTRPIIINSYDKDKISPDDVMVYTRLVTIPEDTIKYATLTQANSTVYQKYIKLATFGTEIITNATVFVTVKNQTGLASLSYGDFYVSTGQQAQSINLQYFTSWLNTFFHHPRFSLDLYTVDANSVQSWEDWAMTKSALPFYNYQNFDTFAVVKDSVIDKLHHVAQISELGLQQDYTKKFRKTK